MADNQPTTTQERALKVLGVHAFHPGRAYQELAEAGVLMPDNMTEQINQVRKIRSLLNEVIELSIRAERHEGTLLVDSPVILAKSVVNSLNEALGDTDD